MKHKHSTKKHKQIQNGSSYHTAFCFKGVIQSPMKTFYTKFHIVADNRYTKVIHMSKLIIYDARRWMATALNLDGFVANMAADKFFVKFSI